MYQSLNDAFSYMVSPAYLSSWGPSILSRVSMPITDDIQMQIRLDYRSRRGVAIGFEPDIRYGEDKKSWAQPSDLFSAGRESRYQSYLGDARRRAQGSLSSFACRISRISLTTSTAPSISPS